MTNWPETRRAWKRLKLAILDLRMEILLWRLEITSRRKARIGSKAITLQTRLDKLRGR